MEDRPGQSAPLPLRILHLEDNPDDSLLVRHQLAEDGLLAEVQLVGDRPATSGRWRRSAGIWGWRIINCPISTGWRRSSWPAKQWGELPFILMSGTIGEPAAIASLQAGATDYILKQHRKRLPAAVRRAVAEVTERVRREAAEADLRRSEKQYRLLFQGNPHPMWVFDLESLAILEVNEAATLHYGYPRNEFLQMTLADLRVMQTPGAEEEIPADIKAQGLVWRHHRKDGSEMDMELIWSPLTFRGKLAALTLATDVTVRRQIIQRNSVLGRLSHNLSVITTPSEAAASICAAADELFHWDDFALDPYSIARDEVTPLLTISTVEGRRVEIPSSPAAQVGQRPGATRDQARRRTGGRGNRWL